MQPKRLQLRERVAFIHEFVLPNSNNTAEMQPYEPNQAKNVVLCKLKTIECIFAPLHPFLLNAVAKNIKKFVPANSNQSFWIRQFAKKSFAGSGYKYASIRHA